jgi:HD-like signal output (HDOD) protein
MEDRPPKEGYLESCVQRIAASEDLPTFAHHITELMATAGDEDATLRRLANLILKNVSLTTKVLRVVNSVYFNRAGRSILSVSHAVTLLGWDSVRHLAAGMLMFDHFRNAARGREQMLISLLTASHARQLAKHARYAHAEEAYLCGMFRNLGELLVSCYLHGAYAEILESIKNNQWTDREACRHVLHFTYEELGQAMARQWHLPEKVILCMDPTDLYPSKMETDRGKVHMITSFSHALSTAVYRMDPDKSQKQIKGLLKQYERVLPLTPDNVHEILRGAVLETQDTFSAAGVSMDNLRLMRQIENVLRDSGLSAASEPEPTPAALPGVVPDRETLAQLEREVAAVVTSDESFGLNDILLMVLEAIFRGGRFDRVVFCLVTSERKLLEARMGLGDDLDAFIEKFRFPLSLLSGPVGPALIQRREVFVDNVGTSRYNQSQFAAVAGASAFAMLPLVVGGNAIGCLYFDRRSGVLGLDDSMKQSLLNLRGYACDAIAKKKAGGA